MIVRPRTVTITLPPTISVRFINGLLIPVRAAQETLAMCLREQKLTRKGDLRLRFILELHTT